MPPFTKFDNIAIKKSQVPLWTREVGALLNPNDFFLTCASLGQLKTWRDNAVMMMMSDCDLDDALSLNGLGSLIP